MGRAGCRTTKSRRSQSESAKQSGATGLSAIILAGLPVGLHSPDKGNYTDPLLRLQ